MQLSQVEDAFRIRKSDLNVRSGISSVGKHINNIYKTGELDKKSPCSILEQVAADDKILRTNLYNLDMIISVG